MNEAFVPVVMQAFDDAKTNYLKGGPSHTSKTQDWDCGPLFRSLKLGIAMIVKHDISVAKATLRTNLIAACVQFTAETNINLGTLQEKIIHAHLMVVHATQKYWQRIECGRQVKLLACIVKNKTREKALSTTTEL